VLDGRFATKSLFVLLISSQEIKTHASKRYRTLDHALVQHPTWTAFRKLWVHSGQVHGQRIAIAIANATCCWNAMDAKKSNMNPLLTSRL